MALENIVVLVGGVGGAKLALGLSKILQPEQLTVIVNTADDFWYYGLRICPDLDTIMYTLSGVVDPQNGWGLANDSRAMLGMLTRYGEETWFGIGDKDIATHLLRTQWLREGCTLTDITSQLTTRLGIACQILPMTDAEVATIVDTVEHGELAFQTYFVRHRWQPTVRSLRLKGIEQATIPGDVQQALHNADCILIAPSNPWLSIAPILSVPEMRDLIIQQQVPRVAITPLIGGQAVKGPTAKLMAELNFDVTTEQVADYYGNVINGFVSDSADAPLAMSGIRTTAMNTWMKSETDKQQLAQNVLNWIGGWE